MFSRKKNGMFQCHIFEAPMTSQSFRLSVGRRKEFNWMHLDLVLPDDPSHCLRIT